MSSNHPLLPTSNSKEDSAGGNPDSPQPNASTTVAERKACQGGPLVQNQNGSVSVAKPADRASMKNKLTRMFTQKDKMAVIAPTSSQQSKTSSSSPPQTSTQPAATKINVAPNDRNAAPPKLPKSPVPLSRFTMVEDAPGGHEHYLKSSRRQEKLSSMFKSLLGRKPDNPDGHTPNDLTLISGWVDSLKREKDAPKEACLDKKTGASCLLTQKYGKCQEVVGRGAFGVVRISHKRSESGTELLYAVKELRRRPEESEKKYTKRLTAEFCISSSLRHPNVIHTLDLVQDAKGDFCEVMEFCPGGDLFSLLVAANKLEVLEADCFFKQMMRGVEYMHEMGVAHRDLKPENLLLTTYGALKITDFGNGECFRMAWENDAHPVSGLCGSGPYIAPEEYVDQEFDARAVDVWACGVIYMAMRTGRHLWRVAQREEDEFYARYLRGRKGEEGYGPIEGLHRVGLTMSCEPVFSSLYAKGQAD